MKIGCEGRIGTVYCPRRMECQHWHDYRQYYEWDNVPEFVKAKCLCGEEMLNELYPRFTRKEKKRWMRLTAE